MTAITSETNYKGVPTEQKERLQAFRATHPLERVDLSGTAWSYLSGGKGTRCASKHIHRSKI